MLKKIWPVFIWGLVNVANATMFTPLSFEKQVEEATSAAEVKLDSARAFKNEAGAIMTEYHFQVLESYHLSNDDLINHQLIITMPGGSVDGITSMIDGAPVFNLNEKSFLLLKNVENKIFLSNFTLGKYKIQNIQGDDFYVSEVFPNDSKVGRILKNEMIKIVKEKWKITESNLKERSEPARTFTVSKPEVQKEFEKRAPAQESAASEEVPVFFWSALILITFLFVFVFFKLNENEKKSKT